VGSDKEGKKAAKAEVKRAKAEMKAVRLRDDAGRAPGALRLPSGVGVAIQPGESGADLVVTGLRRDQLERLVPQVTKEILITVTEDRSAVRGAFLRFVREGLVPTLIKVIAGLIVGFLLVRFGLS
jgi:hypothetical protein